MGMFDSINLKIQCPRCGTVDIIEAQTKELECVLDVFKEGDPISSEHNYIDCLADCRSESCLNISARQLGYRSGFGSMFDVRIFLENGRVSGKYEILWGEN